MHSCGIQEVIVDLVEIGDGTDSLGGNVALIVELLQLAPDVDVISFLGYEFLILGRRVAINPVLDIYYSGAVVDPIRCVRCLGRNPSNLSYEVCLENMSCAPQRGKSKAVTYLCQAGIIYLGIGVWIWEDPADHCQ